MSDSKVERLIPLLRKGLTIKSAAREAGTSRSLATIVAGTLRATGVEIRDDRQSAMDQAKLMRAVARVLGGHTIMAAAIEQGLPYKPLQVHMQKNYERRVMWVAKGAKAAGPFAERPQARRIKSAGRSQQP